MRGVLEEKKKRSDKEEVCKRIESSNHSHRFGNKENALSGLARRLLVSFRKYVYFPLGVALKSRRVTPDRVGGWRHVGINILEAV